MTQIYLRIFHPQFTIILPNVLFGFQQNLSNWNDIIGEVRDYMEIVLTNKTNDDTCMEYEELFNRIASSAQKELELEKEMVLSVIFVRSRTIHAINRDYRQIDRPTDVISFALLDGEELYDYPEDVVELGDVFINIDYAKRQAREYGHSVKREMCFLFTHGLLHCLGYDHMEPEEEKEMFDLQHKLLDPIVSRDE